MVHTFKFEYNCQTYYFLWDIESCSLHKVDYAAFLCGKNRYNKESLTCNEISDFLTINNDVKLEIETELSQLESDGALNAPPLVKDFVKSYDTLKALCLHICHDCNLKCTYCFASGGTYNTDKDYMTADVGKRAIDMLISGSGKRRNLEVDFFGGEPLMNLDVVQEIVEYAKAQALLNDKIFSFTMTTNCMLLNAKNAEYLNQEMENVVLSIDGRDTTHNRVRPTVGGKNSFERALNNALMFKNIRNDKKYYVRGTFTSQNLDFSQDVFALVDAGFDQISLEPVVLPLSHPLALKEEHLDKIKLEYDKLATGYLDRRKNGKWFNFFHFMIDLEKGPCIDKRLTGCGAGTEYLAISPIGDIYPCHQFVGENGFLVGNVFSQKLEGTIRQRFAENTLLKKEHCINCPAKYFCGGGCAANAKNFDGKIEGRYLIGCELTQKRLELSLAIHAIEKLM